MTISEVKIQFVRPNEGLIGFASIINPRPHAGRGSGDSNDETAGL